MKTTYVILFTSLILFGLDLQNSFAQQLGANPKAKLFKVNWQLQITDPDFELKYYKLDDSAYKAFLPKTSWRCNSSSTKKHGNILIKKLKCDYSVEKTGTVTTTVSCSPDRRYSEADLEIYDERKDLTFQVMLNCRIRPN